MRRWALILVPALVALLALLFYGLTGDPRHIPSPLIGQVFPEFTGKDLKGREVVLGRAEQRPMLVNVWASWCVSCRAEHEVIKRGASRYGEQVTFVGINYKDELRNAQRWLAQLGDPYVWSLRDERGRAGIDLGVYGVPETFFVDRRGIIVHKEAGPLTDATLAEGVAMLFAEDKQ